jgi:hypothetical protein
VVERHHDRGIGTFHNNIPSIPPATFLAGHLIDAAMSCHKERLESPRIMGDPSHSGSEPPAKYASNIYGMLWELVPLGIQASLDQGVIEGEVCPEPFFSGGIGPGPFEV